MKNNIFIILLVGIFLTTGCEKFKVGNDFLEKPPSVDVTKDTVFSNLDYANRFLTATYRTLRYAYLYNLDTKGIGMAADVLEALTDEAQSFRLDGAVNSVYYAGQYSSGTENGNNGKYNFTGEDNWLGIRRACLFIENIDRVPDADAATKKEMKAEARMIMACHYCDMYRHFGPVPWVNRSYSMTDDMSSFPRLTSLAYLDSVLVLINKAIPDLPWTIADLSNQDGRFTQAGAMGLKARILLFAASPLFNSAAAYLAGEASDAKLTWNGGYDANLWKRAADAAKELIDKIASQGGYQLVKTGNYRADFKKAYYDRGNGEILISTRVYFRASDAGTGSNSYLYAGLDLMNGHGIACPTDDYVKMFPMATGKPITDPTSGYDSTNPYINRDPRLYETALVNGDTYRGRTAELWIGGRERLTQSQWACASGYNLRKFMLDNDAATSRASIIQYPYLRLAEIYLTYAEATNEFNNGPTADAYKYVNLVRNRVGLSDLPAGLSKDQFREAVLRERACEFYMEDVRWYDLIRWKRDFDFYKKLHGMNIWQNTNGTFRYERFILPTRAWQKNWSPKWYLSAFPPNEVQKGYGLIQNPGW
jgi:hypothetical protein